MIPNRQKENKNGNKNLQNDSVCKPATRGRKCSRTESHQWQGLPTRLKQHEQGYPEVRRSGPAAGQVLHTQPELEHGRTGVEHLDRRPPRSDTCCCSTHCRVAETENQKANFNLNINQVNLAQWFDRAASPSAICFIFTASLNSLNKSNKTVLMLKDAWDENRLISSSSQALVHFGPFRITLRWQTWPSAKATPPDRGCDRYFQHGSSSLLG